MSNKEPRAKDGLKLGLDWRVAASEDMRERTKNSLNVVISS